MNIVYVLQGILYMYVFITILKLLVSIYTTARVYVLIKFELEAR